MVARARSLLGAVFMRNGGRSNSSEGGDLTDETLATITGGVRQAPKATAPADRLTQSTLSRRKHKGVYDLHVGGSSPDFTPKRRWRPRYLSIGRGSP
jgi:hypothetical protein